MLPGMSWKHEEPLEEEPANDSAPLVESNHRGVSGALNYCRQRLPAEIDPTGIEHGYPDSSFSAPNSRHLRSGSRVLRPTIGQAMRLSRKKFSQRNARSANSSLSAIHSSKILKAAGKKRSGPQRQFNAPENVPSGRLQLSFGVDTVEPQPSPSLDRETPRRSKRIRARLSGVAKDPTRTASTNPFNHASHQTQSGN